MFCTIEEFVKGENWTVSEFKRLDSDLTDLLELFVHNADVIDSHMEEFQLLRDSDDVKKFVHENFVALSKFALSFDFMTDVIRSTFRHMHDLRIVAESRGQLTDEIVDVVESAWKKSRDAFSDVKDVYEKFIDFFTDIGKLAEEIREDKKIMDEVNEIDATLQKIIREFYNSEKELYPSVSKFDEYYHV